MKNRIVIYVCVIFTIFITGVYFIINSISNHDKFNYNSARDNTINYLDKNEKELIKIANSLYENKSSESKPYKGVTYATYKDKSEIKKWNEKEYIKFDLESQGMLGGQYYGLIYSNDKDFFDSKKLVIYDENKETGEGNNIFIRQKIKTNWYFYYDDYDGKVDINKIK